MTQTLKPESTSRPLLIDGCQINQWTTDVISELHDGGVDLVQATCAVWEGARETLDELMAWQQRFDRHPDSLALVRAADDITAAREGDRLGILLGFQNTAPLEDDARLLGIYHALGVRVVQLTYNAQNLVGSGCLEPVDGGLSRFGRCVVDEMNRLGMLIDCSHVGDQTTRDAIDQSSGPVALTHANPRWFCDHPRNAPDDVLNAVAARGGVVGVTTYPTFIGGVQTSRREFCQMVVRLCEQIGADHVALGSDLSRGWTDDDLTTLRNGRLVSDPEPAQWPQWQPWFSTARDFPALLDELRDTGLSDADLTAVTGGNWTRLYRQIF